MNTKQKLSEVAKDLNISNNELTELITAKFGVVKKPSANIAPEEMTYILEYYTQNNMVENFDAYFASKNDKPARKPVPKPAPKAEEAAKPAPAPAQNAQPAKPVQGAQSTQNAQNGQAARPAASAQQARPAQNGRPSQPQQQARPAQNGQHPQNSRPNDKPAMHVPQKTKSVSQVEKFKEQAAKATEHKNQPQRPKQEIKPRPEQQTNKTKLNVNFSSENVAAEKTHTIDTRGSYVELDKYNERYENIAPANGGGKRKDNFSKKQKLTQKSALRNKQQYSTRRETESEKLKRLELERARKQQLKVLIPDEISVSELASRLKVTANAVIKKLMILGVMASINEVIDYDTAALVAEELGAKVEKEVIVTIEERLISADSDDDDAKEERPPVVVVMGHVDHGKTSLLDKIRNANVTASEAGGITQHIGAYQVNISGKNITFLDTPGHEAFTSMRARGANITDIAILVVAADDGIMPQTVESINHAKAAGISIIVAINKMDKPEANPDKVKQELTEHELVCEDWGGDIICVPVSAKTGEGIDNLLENILLVAEMKELKANPNRLAKGAVIEARLDKGRGPIATILVQNGTLKSGDVIIAGTSVGRVRVMTDDKGRTVKEAGPSVPVEITGLAEVPSAGDTFNAVEDERLARELVDQRKHEAKQEEFKSYQKVTLDNLFSQIEQGEIKELPIIIKADVQGSVEAVKQSLEKLTNDEVRVRVIHGAVGAVSEGDVMLANASNAIIVGFNVRPDPVAAESAQRDGVDIRLYRIIYDAIEEISTAMKGMLAPKFRENLMGRIEVRQVYRISNVGSVAGSYVVDGKVTRQCQIRVVRDGIVITEDKIDSLKRFKEDAKEVAQGYECGIGLEKFNDIKEGDIFEAFIMEEYRED